MSVDFERELPVTQLGLVLADDDGGEADRSFRNVLDAVSEAVLLVCLRETTIVYANRAVAALFGSSAVDATGSHLKRLFPSTWHDMLASARTAGDGCSAKFESVHHSSSGVEVLLEVVVTRVTYGGRATALCEIRDTTKRRRMTERIKENRLRHKLIASVTSDGLWEWDLASNCIDYSPQWKHLIGYGPCEIGVSPNEWFIRIHPDDAERIHLEMTLFLESRGDAPLETRHRLLHRDGSYRWMLLRIIAARSPEGEARRLIGAHTDVTDRRNAEEQLERKAFYDPLTDLPNRALFMDRLAYAVTRYKRHSPARFAVLFVDLDRFKMINDSLGHLAGDQLLIEIARRLEACVRHTDTLARLGGDEFAILLDPILEANDARVVADRIQADLARPFDIDGHTVFSSASIGIALSSPARQTPEDFLREADIAMYRAKSAGKARYEIFDEAMQARVKRFHEIESDLRAAVERDELCVFYQPIVSLRSGQPVGFEALARWRHPERGLVSPGEFIPVAEETGLIATIDGFVLREACRQLREWHLQHPAYAHLTVSVNLSGRLFSQRNLVDLVDESLAESGLDPRFLKIEITETALMDSPESAAEILAELRSRGIRLLLDDFGTGYSSLGYLNRLPIDTIKIDRAFVAQLDAVDRRERVIVRTVAMLARSLGLDVIAEGIETDEQLARLKSLKCEYGQGYLFSKPMDADLIPDYLVAEARDGGWLDHTSTKPDAIALAVEQH